MSLKSYARPSLFFLNEFDIASFAEFIPFAQQSLDLRLGLNGSGNQVIVKFKHKIKPWLAQKRQGIATYEQQMEELTKDSNGWSTKFDNFKRHKGAARRTENYYSLVDVLVRFAKQFQKVDDATLKLALLALNPDILIKLGMPSILNYFACTISISKISLHLEEKEDRSGVYIKLLDPLQPFLESKDNDFYFKKRKGTLSNAA